jgi:hypothetical protein
MSLVEAWRTSRLRRRFMSESAVLSEELAAGRAPDATVDEVGAAGENIGFDPGALAEPRTPPGSARRATAVVNVTRNEPGRPRVTLRTLNVANVTHDSGRS